MSITNTGASVTFTRTDGTAGSNTVVFKFVDEAGNKSVNYTQELINLDDA